MREIIQIESRKFGTYNSILVGEIRITKIRSKKKRQEAIEELERNHPKYILGNFSIHGDELDFKVYAPIEEVNYSWSVNNKDCLYHKENGFMNIRLPISYASSRVFEWIDRAEKILTNPLTHDMLDDVVL